MIKLLVLMCSLLMIFSLWAQENFPECMSVKERPISHFDFLAREDGLKKRILVVGGIHGDEEDSYGLSMQWLQRLQRIGRPSNTWRVIPLLNPDGKINKTRSNAHNVDLNRNFPTKDWEELALSLWEKKLHSNPRRYPGAKAGSEPEVRCLMKHIEDFRPDLVVSIHTPYGQFDFDGPLDKRPISKLLPWKRIGTFPGSLGRYLWDERKIPVLTIELKPDTLHKHLGELLKIQDAISDLI
jgi:murein peptide amidase A